MIIRHNSSKETIEDEIRNCKENIGECERIIRVLERKRGTMLTEIYNYNVRIKKMLELKKTAPSEKKIKIVRKIKINKS